MNDGQNLFDAATAFAGNEWGLDGFPASVQQPTEPSEHICKVGGSGGRGAEYWVMAKRLEHHPGHCPWSRLTKFEL